MADTLSNVLDSLRLKGAVFLHARFTAPFAVNTQLMADDWRPLLSDAADLIAYHFVLEGRLTVSVDDAPPLAVSAGEIVLVPRNRPHRLASGPTVGAVDSHTLIQPAADGGLHRVEYGGGGEPARMVCGFLGCRERAHPLIQALPPLLSVSLQDSSSRSLVESSLSAALSELTAGRPAAGSMLARIAELLLAEAIRGYVERAAPQGGWLRGLTDPQIGGALALIHEDIARPWTAEALARQVGLSRSAFIQRFGDLVGMPPFRYLTLWRMETAKLQLRETARAVGQIAYAVGYESEEAFNRAFRREVGSPPAAWRHSQASA